MPLSAEEVRRVNLVEVLTEDLEEAGAIPPEVPEHAVTLWSEEQIREFFAKMGVGCEHFPAPGNGAETRTPAEIAEAYPPPDSAEFSKWFPGLERSKTQSKEPKARLLCFPNAGNEENLYTNEGVGARKVDTLLAHCRANGIEVLAVQLPGRGMRRKEAFITNAKAAAAALLPVVAHRLLADGKPYFILAHSVGTWVSYELLQAFKAARLPMPKRCFLSAFPSPTWPADRRPWTPQRTLQDPAFKDEARGWDVNEVVFSGDMFPTYGPLMRADFTLFDEYEFTHAADARLAVPLTTFYATDDKKVTQAMVQSWCEVSADVDGPHAIHGHHLYPMGLESQKAAKVRWLGLVVAGLAV